jgi:adenylate cyclase
MPERDATAATFDREFARALLALERLRVTVLFGTFATLAVILALLFRIEDATFTGISAQSGLRWATLLILVGSLPFLLVLRRRVVRCLARDEPLPGWWRVASVVVETALPTTLIVSFVGWISVSEALVAPPVTGYFLVILLSTLTMHVRQCVATGVAIAVAYLAVVLANIPAIQADFPGTMFSIWPPYVMRALMMLMGGVLAGIITQQIRRRVEHALRSALERDRVLDVFGQHVSPAVVDKLLSQPAELAPETRRLCVMFVDIRDFTRFSERRPPQDVVDYLNTLSTTLAPSATPSPPPARSSPTSSASPPPERSPPPPSASASTPASPSPAPSARPAARSTRSSATP